MYSKFSPLKTPEEISARLLKLKDRYRNNYVKSHQKKLPENCVYNYIHEPLPLPNVTNIESKHVPNRSVQLVIIQEEKPIRICTYGSSTPNTWNGDICDHETMSSSCEYFKAKTELKDLEAEFDSNMSDDALVLAKYPDIAALQWVLNDRVYKLKWNFKRRILSVIRRVIRYFRS